MRLRSRDETGAGSALGRWPRRRRCRVRRSRSRREKGTLQLVLGDLAHRAG